MFKIIDKKSPYHTGFIVENFNENEFLDPIEDSEIGLFVRLNKTRLNLKKAIYPSKTPGAMSRKTYSAGSGPAVHTPDLTAFEFFKMFGKCPSRHQVMADRKCQAIDFFTDANSLEALYYFISSNLWSGIGIYFDKQDNNGKRKTMFHLDFGRNDKAIWYYHERRYHYSGGFLFWETLESLLHSKS